MGEGTRVLGKLMGLQQTHVDHALNRPKPRVGSEFLVAEYGQAFL